MDDPQRERENLKLGYERALADWRALADIRFKLLGLVPAVSAAVIGILSKNLLDADGAASPAALQVASLVACLGFLATFGISIYELRNSQLYNAAHRRATELAKLLGLPDTHRPGRSHRLFFVLPVWHDLALAIIYSSTLGGWTLVASYAALRLARTEGLCGYGSTTVSTALAAAVATVFALEMLRLDHAASQNTERSVTRQRSLALRLAITFAISLGIACAASWLSSRLDGGLSGSHGFVLALAPACILVSYAISVREPSDKGLFARGGAVLHLILFLLCSTLALAALRVTTALPADWQLPASAAVGLTMVVTWELVRECLERKSLSRRYRQLLPILNATPLAPRLKAAGTLFGNKQISAAAFARILDNSAEQYLSDPAGLLHGLTAREAYLIWQKHGRQPGTEMADWLAAEDKVTAGPTAQKGK